MKICHLIDGTLTPALTRLGLAALLAAVPLAASAQATIQTLDQIAAAATAHVRQQLQQGASRESVIHVSVVSLDSRLRLPACSGKPEGFSLGAARIAARMTVGVRCGQPQWTVYVPVKIETEMPVLTLRRAAARLAALTAEDVELRPLRVPGLAEDYLTDAGQLAGRHLKTPAAPGTPLTTGLLVRDTLIKRGQRVTLIASVGGLEVRAQGEAIADATAAGRVRVLNLGSRKIIEGRVETEDRVRVDL